MLTPWLVIHRQLHFLQVLQELAFDRGLDVDFHQQLNIGGNTDFNNMMVQSRLASKKRAKKTL